MLIVTSPHAVQVKGGLERNLATMRDSKGRPIVQVSQDAREPVPGRQDGRKSVEIDLQLDSGARPTCTCTCSMPMLEGGVTMQRSRRQLPSQGYATVCGG